MHYNDVALAISQLKPTIKMHSPHYKCNHCNMSITMWIPLIVGVKVLHSICNMGTHGLPDMFILSPWALGVQIRQTTCTHVRNACDMSTGGLPDMYTRKPWA